jgi:hypothetical protein
MNTQNLIATNTRHDDSYGRQKSKMELKAPKKKSEIEGLSRTFPTKSNNVRLKAA